VTPLGPTLLVLAAQVTLPAVGGLVLSRRRDSAAACGPLTVAAAAVLLLTPLAFLPRPTWPAHERPVETAPEAVAVGDTEPIKAATESPGIDLLKLLRLAHVEPATTRSAEFDGWQVTAFVLLGLAGLGLGRFALGLAHTARVVRTAHPVADQDLLTVADELRAALGCRRRIELRESGRVGTAATAGWRRPVILIATTWRLWSASERRAVLAHEFAHVARGDFAARLIAHLAVAVHGYHPLVRWLRARLALRQEMAADALAAGPCGGRSVYLKCLAALALKADARPVGPVPTFLSGPRTLLRRIAMLRVTDDTPPRRRWPARLAVALLAACALGLHGTTPEALAGPVVPAGFAEKNDRPPLDASYLLPSDHPDVVGVYAVRLGELFRTPGMEKVAEQYATALKSVIGDRAVHFKPSDVEQVSGRVSLTREPKKPAPNRSVSLSLTSVRMATEFDWVKQLRAWTTDWKEHAHGGGRYYSGKLSVPGLGPADATVWFYLPDGRTVVLESEENIKKLIDAKAKPLPAPAWAGDWKDAEGGMFALVIPDVKGKLANTVPTEKLESDLAESMRKPLMTVCSKATRAAVGIDLGKGCSVTIRLACASAADAADVDAGCQVIAKLAEAALDEPAEAADPFDKASLKLSAYLVRGIEFGKTVDHVVEVRMSAPDGLTDLLKAFNPGK
jgi:beta-lactamase regulating signal transducer with metallopeptidase domain